MFELKFKDLDKLTSKAERIIRLKTEREKNCQIYSEAFNQLLANPGALAVLALLGDNVKFENKFDNPKIILEREYGIKGGRYVHYIGANDTLDDDEDEFAEQESNTATESKQNISVKKAKGIRYDKMVIEIMKYTDDIESVYNSFAEQIVNMGNALIEIEE